MIPETQKGELLPPFLPKFTDKEIMHNGKT